MPFSHIAGAMSSGKTELRGVWLTNIDSDVLFSSNRLTTALQQLKNLHFNTVYPTVWNGGYTLYPSAVAEKTFGQSLDPHPGLQKRDMLKEIVQKGHQQGISVIPWLEFGLMAPADSELARRHPDWLTQKRDGSKIWKEGVEERVWLNPFHPEVQQFIINLITEIVSKYDIDGIQFDDHFGLPAQFGYDPLTVGMYQKEIKSPPDDSFQETFWIRWRADKINEFMGRIFQAVKARKPKCIISLSPNPLHFSLPAHLQDWFTWERRGYIEEIVLQVYRSDMPRFNQELKRAEVDLAKTHIPVSVGILSGLKSQFIPISQIEQQVKNVRQQGFSGVAFFFYESLWNISNEPPEERQSTFKALFPKNTFPPNIYTGWKPK